MEKRLFYLDAARGFAILLVVLGHIWETEQLLPVLIYSFHVPLFFIISGILTAYTRQERRPTKLLLFSRSKSLIIPYVFYELIFVVLFGIRNHFDFGSQHFYDGLLLQPLNVPLWFLPTLFLSELFLIALIKLTGRNKAGEPASSSPTGSVHIIPRYVCPVICLIVYLIPFFVREASPLCAVLMRCCSSIGFLAIGYFSFELVQTREFPLYVLLPVLTASGTLAWLNGKTGIYKLTFHNPLLFTFCAVAGSYCVIFLLKKYRLKLLELIGKSSLTILGLHIIILRILQEILGIHTDSIPGGLAALVFICVLLVPVSILFKKIQRFFLK